MNREPIIVQRLVSALDDSRSLYEKAADKVVDPRLLDLLEYIVGTHWLIADDLAKHFVETGGEMTRQGSRLGPLRIFLTGRFAQLSLDTDMAYVNSAAKREAGILRGLHEAKGSVRHTGLRNHLRMHCCKIERVATQIRSLRATMQLRVDLQATPALTGKMRAFPKRVTAR